LTEAAVPGPHQVPPAFLPGPDQVAGRLLIRAGRRHHGDLVQPQQPGQVDRVLRVGLDGSSRFLVNGLL
jgi:hypothetical protein